MHGVSAGLHSRWTEQPRAKEAARFRATRRRTKERPVREKMDICILVEHLNKEGQQSTRPAVILRDLSNLAILARFCCMFVKCFALRDVCDHLVYFAAISCDFLLKIAA